MNKERGWIPPTRAQFEELVQDRKSALVVGSPKEVAEKIIQHGKTMGGVFRFNFQMDVGLSHEQMKRSIELIGNQVSPLVKSIGKKL